MHQTPQVTNRQIQQAMLLFILTFYALEMLYTRQLSPTALASILLPQGIDHTVLTLPAVSDECS